MAKMLEYGFDPACEVQVNFDAEILVIRMPEHGKGLWLSGADRVVPGISIANSEVAGM